MWRQRLECFPRIRLAAYPTPLEPLPRLSAALGRAIYVKRDDTIGPAMGGNKVRKLEYLLGEALETGNDKVVTFGGLQSNHARMTAAAARRCGLEPHLFFFERRPDRLRGNLLLNELLGAHMHFVPFGGGSSESMSLETINRLVHWLAWLWIGRHYFVPVGGHSWRGCLGYVRAAVEIHAQAEALGIQDARLVVATGSGGTLAGLLAGLTLLASPMGLVGIDVGKLWKGFPASIARMAAELCTHLGAPHTFTPQNVPLVEERYVGPGYAVPTPAGDRAMRLLAQKEGLILDPVYTGKACAGLLDMLERGQLGADEPVIFMHTGGGPGLFASNSKFRS